MRRAVPRRGPPRSRHSSAPSRRAPIYGRSWPISPKRLGKDRSMSRIIGIDLGTTNSLVAYVDERTGLPRVIPDLDGKVLLPSVVSFTPEGTLVGEPARRQLVRRPERTVYSVKRFMGRGYDDVKEELRYFPFVVKPAEGIVRLDLNGREVTPPEVSAIVLRALKERAEAH